MQYNMQSKEEKSEKKQRIKIEVKWLKFWIKSYQIINRLKKVLKEPPWQSNNNVNHCQFLIIEINLSKHVWTTEFWLLSDRQEVERQHRSPNTYMRQVLRKKVKLDARNQEESQQWVWQKESVNKWMLY